MASQPVSLFPPARAAQGVSYEPEFLIPERAGVAYAAPGAFLAWLQRAQAGQVCIYARANMLSRREPIAATVGMIAGAKQVETWQTRPSSILPFHYCARRTTKPLIVALSSPQERRTRDALTPDQAALFARLCELADARQRCPSNTELGVRLGLTKGAIGALLLKLEGFGLIRRLADHRFDRVVEIVETGARTAGIVIP